MADPATGAGDPATGAQAAPAELTALLDDPRMREWLSAQRWYASKTRAVTGLELVEQARVGAAGQLVLALVQARFAQGTHALYQLPLTLEERSQVSPGNGDPICAANGVVAFDAARDPSAARELIAQIDASADVETECGRFAFRHVESSTPLPAGAEAKMLGAEQSNTSIVLGERLVLKIFRKLEAGINPDLEMLRFLTARGFPNIAALHGWYEYEGTALAATLGIAQALILDGSDGWELALDEIVTAPDTFLERLGSLGTATAQMHNVLASDASDPAFSPQEPSQEALALLSATIDEDIERLFIGLPDDPRLAPIAGRGQDVRERLTSRTQLGADGRHIRIHGDYHLGQTLHTPRGWVILDFEGEPARPLAERRVKRSPLRDVASMLRSFAYVTSAVKLLRDREAPSDFEQRARIRFLECYFSAVDPALLPAGDTTIANLLAIFELEKAIYELRYELDHRPDWVAIPVAGIVRILETS
jgi:trehalose synthase-fused probable maltokinase